MLLSLPIILTRLLSLQRRVRPPQELLSPTSDALAISLFPIAWFFGFLYYTDLPSVVFVLLSVLSAFEGNHLLSALVSSLEHPDKYVLILSTARSCELYVPTDQYNMGRVCIRIQSTQSIAIPA